MAVAFRAAGATAFSANNVANPTNLAPALPTRVSGDLLLCLAASRSITATIATPAGWTVLANFPLRSATASGGSIYAFAKVSDGTDSVPTIAWSGLTTGTNGDSSSATIFSYSGVDTSNLATVIDGTASANDAASTTTITLPSITTAVANSMVIGHVLKINDTVHTFTGGRTNERLDTHTTTGTGHGQQVTDEVKVAAGASGTASVTPSTTVSSRTLAVTLSLKAGVTLQTLSATCGSSATIKRDPDKKYVSSATVLAAAKRDTDLKVLPTASMALAAVVTSRLYTKLLSAAVAIAAGVARSADHRSSASVAEGGLLARVVSRAWAAAGSSSAAVLRATAIARSADEPEVATLSRSSVASRAAATSESASLRSSVGRVLAGASALLGTLRRDEARSLAAQASQSPEARMDIAAVRTAQEGSTGILTTLRARLLDFLASTSEAASIRRSTATSRSAASSEAASSTRSASRQTSAATPTQADLDRDTGRTLPSTEPSSASTSRDPARSLPATSPEVASIATLWIPGTRILAAVVGSAAALVRGARRIVAGTAPESAALRRDADRTVLAPAPSVAARVRRTYHSTAAIVTEAAEAEPRIARVLGLIAAVSGNVSLTRAVGRRVAGLAPSSAARVRSITASRAAGQPASANTRRSISASRRAETFEVATLSVVQALRDLVQTILRLLFRRDLLARVDAMTQTEPEITIERDLLVEVEAVADDLHEE